MDKNNIPVCHYFIVGGAGFIGSHLVKKVIGQAKSITIFDNFSSGQQWHLGKEISNPKLNIIKEDIKNLAALTEAMQGKDIVFHFASNPDIAKAATQPDIDFWEGTYLTQNVLEAMRLSSVKHLIYASGSGIYGDTGEIEVSENYSPMLPISTYGASKLACEALICSYCHMFEMNAAAFRFANVVGPHQTHGVGYDFIRYLTQDENNLTILGDGSQSKSYIYVDDVIDALLLVAQMKLVGYDYFNVATQDYITVREIADLVAARMNLTQVKYKFTGGDRGWKGDVPVVRFNTDKIRALGWANQRTSREALTGSVDSMIIDVKAGRIA